MPVPVPLPKDVAVFRLLHCRNAGAAENFFARSFVYSVWSVGACAPIDQTLRFVRLLRLVVGRLRAHRPNAIDERKSKNVFCRVTRRLNRIDGSK